MSLTANQCEVVYINPILTATTGVPIPSHKEFSAFAAPSVVRSGKSHWNTSPAMLDICLKTKPALPMAGSRSHWASGAAADQSPAFQLELTARGFPQGAGRDGIVAFHKQGHLAIVRCFAAITTPEMHKLWERDQ